MSWLTHKEPRGPRPVCSLLLERLGKVEAEAAGLLDDGSGAGLGRKGGCKGMARAGWLGLWEGQQGVWCTCKGDATMHNVSHTLYVKQAEGRMRGRAAWRAWHLVVKRLLLRCVGHYVQEMLSKAGGRALAAAACTAAAATLTAGTRRR